MAHTFKKTAPIFAAALLAASVAFADAGTWFAPDTFSGTLTLTTDYVFRGVSQTDENWAVQGSFDWTAPAGLYLGTWASNLAYAGTIEMDFYGGYASEWNGLSYDLGANYYAYPMRSVLEDIDSDIDPDFNFYEVYLNLGYTLPIEVLPTTLGFGYAYSPDYYGEDGTGTYLNGSLEFSLPAELSLAGEVGYLDVKGDQSSDGFDYTFYRVGAGYSVVGFDLDLSWWSTSNGGEDFFGKLAESRVVFSVSRSL